MVGAGSRCEAEGLEEGQWREALDWRGRPLPALLSMLSNFRGLEYILCGLHRKQIIATV